MDERVLSALAHFQEQLQEMSARFQELKDITYDLYKEKEELREENRQLRKLVFKGQKEGVEVRKGEGYSNLINLYDKGYHVCHLSYGEPRRRDCLFCQQLLENNFKGSDNEGGSLSNSG
ncbi:MAG: initiation-control protein YabA [Halanaerobiaceae bacterium]